MRKHINKALRTKGMRFYLSPDPLNYIPDLNRCTLTTKKRVLSFTKSIKLMNICEGVYTDHAQNYTAIYFNHGKWGNENV